MTTILLARHGQASFGQENYDQLSELGGIQAQLLGQHYATTQRRIDAIFTGSLVRQRDSAQHFWERYQSSITSEHSNGALASVIDVNEPNSYTLPEFDEFNHKDVFIKSDPVFNSRAAIAAEIAKSDVPDTRLAELFDQAMQRWHSGDNDQDYVESWPQFSQRAQQALEQVRQRVAGLNLDRDSTVLVFTSGGVIAAITAQLLKQGSQTAYQLNKSLVNTGVTSVTLKNQSARLMSLNEYSHLFSEGKRFVTWR
ncbi:MAG: histidine phosphatase family protein [Psychrobacter sp.]|jgi:broad specificity phosphatase PhoE|uniref:Histidine phosphatase family protein n=1 Tax=Psychrobacter namhaensis TaxID=292734 RepID=A0ABW8L6C3_9GAMM|nr:histidine phosphatase family protein [Psychrobacter sp. CCUG 69069]MCD1279012.1 histidine phosphatase family protein [Psychrobacter sp. CCUG 69069]MCD6251033.1 histidine phosphatase family protein [Psychrobacter sp.]